MKDKNSPYIIETIAEQHLLLSLPKPQHPLVSVFRFENIINNETELKGKFSLNFYCIAVKKGFKGKMKYGQNYYDFDEGIMSFIAPGQMLSVLDQQEQPPSGFCLVFHKDLIAQYALAKEIKKYGFFSYGLHEALHLSEKEEAMLAQTFVNIETEINERIDNFSQDVIVSHIELLLNYSNRFYNRQFITRKNVGHDLLINLEKILDDFYDAVSVQNNNLLTVEFIAEQLHVSPGYLSDMLRSLTGQNTQQHLHNKLIEKAKEILTSTNLSVSEIAYQLGFEYPQSFNKLFKNKTKLSPLAYRQSFN